jgi:hypothetical protein
METHKSVNFTAKSHYFQASINSDRRSAIREGIALLKACARDESVQAITAVVVRKAS